MESGGSVGWGAMHRGADEAGGDTQGKEDGRQ
jgi:hypothetical protein